MKLKRLALILLGLSVIHSATFLTQDSVYYSAKQDIRCLECLINEPLKDSLIKLYKVNQSEQDTIITNLSTHNAILIQMDKDNKIELKKRRKNVFKGTFFGLVSGSILTLLAIIFT